MPSERAGDSNSAMSDDERDIEYDEGLRTIEDDAPPEIEVPWERLSVAALKGVIEEFVTREGTDYGHAEVDLADKVAEVRKQLERGEVVVLFDARTESVNLARARDVRR